MFKHGDKKDKEDKKKEKKDGRDKKEKEKEDRKRAGTAAPSTATGQKRPTGMDIVFYK